MHILTPIKRESFELLLGGLVIINAIPLYCCWTVHREQCFNDSRVNWFEFKFINWRFSLGGVGHWWNKQVQLGGYVEVSATIWQSQTLIAIWWHVFLTWRQ